MEVLGIRVFLFSDREIHLLKIWKLFIIIYGVQKTKSREILRKLFLIYK